ncbi:iron-containing alcohol dehydrogenase [Thetidibacter halocola]|uniref:Iron-containing alcohol dehydrogenase n=1 Tax=Thetidibacter halocola TaxID=2827239 RepID=A0A8J7W8F9_9RHOB|nr:iron-containing alcohol dehydrogenase [Thetidibacter halocola]MBS0122810.1 iron-containing alcohol dehydrogenase [Thetidibacter halocola]
MPLDLVLSDLSRLDRVRQVLAENDPNRQFAALDMAEVHISDEVLSQLTEVIDRHLLTAGRPPSRSTEVRMIVDPVTIRRGAADLKAEVEALLRARYAVTRVTLDDGHAILHADEPVLDAAARASVGADVIVSVGGGTITDVAKIAAERAGVPVHVVVQTAASVDGYTDNFAVVLQNGVKTTLLSRWPEAVLTDTRVIADAPHYLNASGFGELLSMYAAPGDWYLASRMGMDPKYAPVLLEMLGLCGEGVEEWSTGVGTGEPEACARLATALAMRGIVTGVGGTTASLSGMEHLVSHMFDMVAGELHEPTGLHGAQVGVGSVIRAAAWEVFCERVEEEGLDTDRLFPGVGTREAAVKDSFAWLDASGRIGAECWGRYQAKMTAWHGNRARIEATFADWSALRAEHDRLVFGSHRLARYLHRAGSPKRFIDLDPAPSADRLAWVVANCQFMRERFTVADLLTLAGWWDEAGVARVLDRVEAACVAAERGA